MFFCLNTACSWDRDMEPELRAEDLTLDVLAGGMLLMLLASPLLLLVAAWQWVRKWRK